MEEIASIQINLLIIIPIPANNVIQHAKVVKAKDNIIAQAALMIYF